MDKYEYRLKAEQIETQVNKRDYEAAAKIADTIDWRRVKNLNMLYMVSEVYEKTERYGECMEILDMAYDRAPVGRMLLYRMTEVCTKMHNFDEAIALYREFVKAAPHDLSRYILKYQIYRERGSSLEDQIKVLSEYKKQDYQEKWGYELACLYEEAGMLEECVRECDQLFLWYSEGEYVQKALELKMKYEPLTLLQKEKYNYQRIGSDSSVYEAGSQKPEVPGVDVGRFSTVNLQAELAENLDQLLKEDATIDLPQLKVVNKNTVSINQEPDSLYCEDGTIDLPELGPDGKVIEPDDREDGTIELPSLGLDKEEEDAPESEPELGYREDGTIELPELGPDGKVVKPDFREDGTIELPTLGLDEEEGEPEAESGPEPDFREDGTIELPELGPDGQATEPDFREDGTIELPNLGLGEEEEEPVMESEPEPDFREDGTIELPNLGLDGEGEEPEAESEPEPDFREDKTIELPNLDLEGDAPEKDADGPVSIDDILSEWEKQKEQTEAKLEAAAKEEKVRRAKVKQETAELMKLISGISEEIPEDVRQILDEIDKENQAAEEPVVTEDDLPPDVDEEEETEEELDIENLAEKEEPEDLTEREEAGEGRSGNMIQDLERSLSSKVSEGAVSAGHLTREQARLFTYFTSIQGMSEQLSVLFKDVNQREQTSSSRGNLTITGERGNGKTTLAIDIVKALQKQKRIEGKKLAKISGQKMNTKDIYEVLTKLKGGALIIEKAGGLSDATMMAMSLAMETDTGGLLVILEDSSEEIQKLFVRNRNFASKFDHTIDIPIFTNDELVAFGKSYAQEQRYSFDEFGILALYDRIGSRQTNDHLVTVAEVKEMIDDAIQKAEKGSIRHLFEKVTKKSVDEFGYHLIREADFEE